MKKTILLSLALITAAFLTATAQNDISIPKKYPGEKTIFESPNFEIPNLPAIKKAKTGQDWWEPDTIYAFYRYTNELDDRRIIQKYNSHGLLIEYIDQYGKNNSWETYLLTTYTYTYDSNYNVLTCLRDDSLLYTYTYDSNNNMLTCLRDNSLLYTYTYDSNNNMLTELRQDWVNNSWENYSLITYTYDSNNNRLTRRWQSGENNPWEISPWVYTYTYDSNNNLITELLERWRNNSVQSRFLTTYTYDSNNNRLTEVEHGWRDGDSWVAYELVTNTYDSDNNLLTELRQMRSNDSSWVNDIQYRMTYDENGNSTSADLWWWIGESWQPFNDPPVNVRLYYNKRQSYFQLNACHKLTASYINVADLTAIVKPSSTSDLNAISIYPNPTRGELRIENGEWRITDIQVFDRIGVQVLHTQQTALNISHLPAGIYLVQIKTQKGIVTKKLVKL